MFKSGGFFIFIFVSSGREVMPSASPRGGGPLADAGNLFYFLCITAAFVTNFMSFIEVFAENLFISSSVLSESSKTFYFSTILTMLFTTEDSFFPLRLSAQYTFSFVT